MAKGDICTTCTGGGSIWVQPTRTVFLPNPETGELEKKEVNYGSPYLIPCPTCAGSGRLRG